MADGGIDDPYSIEQLRDPRMNISVVRPLVDRLYELDDVSISTLIAFLLLFEGSISVVYGFELFISSLRGHGVIIKFRRIGTVGNQSMIGKTGQVPLLRPWEIYLDFRK